MIGAAVRTTTRPLLLTAAASASVTAQMHLDASADVNGHTVLTMAVAKNIVGAVVFALSSALTSSGTGLLPGVGITLAIGAMSALSFCLVGGATAAHLDEDEGATMTTEDLWHATVRHGSGLVAVVVLIQACGSLIQYTATCAELLGPTVARHLSRPARIATVGVALLPLARPAPSNLRRPRVVPARVC
jgi:hypothetical protein